MLALISAPFMIFWFNPLALALRIKFGHIYCKESKGLSRSPHMGVATSERKIRILAPIRYPYRVYYTVQANQVIVLHIRHTARQRPQDLEP